MDKGIDSAKSFRRQNSQEHDEIIGRVAALSQVAARLDPLLPDPHIVRRLQKEIRDLREMLLAHFATEEKTDLLAGLRQALPEAKRQLETILKEHGEIIDTLDKAERAAQTSSPLSAEGLHRELHQLEETLVSHEASEEQLMRSAREEVD